MSETNSNLAEALAAILKPIVEEAVQEAMNGHHDGDKLLKLEKAAQKRTATRRSK